MQISLIEQCALIYCRCRPFSEVNFSIFVDVYSVKKLSGIKHHFFTFKIRINFFVRLYEFRLLNFTITVYVKKVKTIVELLLFLFCRQMCDHKSQSRLFQFTLCLYLNYKNAILLTVKFFIRSNVSFAIQGSNCILTFFTIHGCFMAYAAVSLLVQSLSSNFNTKSFASYE